MIKLCPVLKAVVESGSAGKPGRIMIYTSGSAEAFTPTFLAAPGNLK
jgi:hypothetical protein